MIYFKQYYPSKAMTNKFIILLIFAFASSNQLYAQRVITKDDISASENMNGLHYNDAKRDSMLDGLSKNLKTYTYYHSLNLKNDAPLPLSFNVTLEDITIPVKQCIKR